MLRLPELSSLGATARSRVPAAAACRVPSARPVAFPRVLRQQQSAKAPVARRLQPAAAFRTPVVFFIDSNEGVKLPLEPQELLGLKSGEIYKDSIINQAYDELMLSPVEPGYSQQTVSGRAELLDIARNDIITSKGKVFEKREINIPYDLIPGALALMAEVGQDEIVMYLGKEMLASGELDEYLVLKQDVLLSMALAKVNMARDVFEAGNQIATGCRHLEEALQLLQPVAPGEGLLAPDLAKEIKKSLAELRSQCALEQVSGPLHKDTHDVRKRAVRTIRELLKQPEVEISMARTRGATAPAAAPVSPELMAKVMQQLTSEEVVHLQEWEAIAKNPGPYKWVYPGLLERVAVGHILVGFMQCQPAYVKMALNILKQVPSSAEVLVMQAVCQVLLGAVQSSMDLLQQAEAMGSARGARSSTNFMVDSNGAMMSNLWSTQAYSFVQENTPAGEDGLLPGLCLFTELWLAKVALPLFRDTEASPPSTSLVKYFDDARVETLITVYDERNEGSLASSISSALSEIRKTVSSVAGAAAGGPAVGSSAALDPLAWEEPPNRKLLVGAGVLGALGLAALASMFMRSSDSSAPSASSAATASGASLATAKSVADSPASRKVYTAAGQLDAKAAEQVVRAWQEAKQLALGPDYETGLLSTMLADPMLGEMRSKVAKFKEEGWFMRYKLHRVRVQEVEVSSSSSQATVVASLEESANLYGVDGRQADGYKSTYEARYHMSQAKDGSWRISKVIVMGDEPGGK